jgi:hypothetical protein
MFYGTALYANRNMLVPTENVSNATLLENTECAWYCEKILQ